MREKPRDKERLFHILDACNILIDSKERESIESIKESRLRFYGYVKLVEIIGEATYNITKEYRAAHPEVPWKMMEGMRHVLVHDYYMISPDKLWDTIQNDIPALKPQIEKLLEEM